MTITGQTRLAAVIGWPVAHSKSPLLFGYWCERYRIDGALVPLAVEPGDFEQVLSCLPKMNFAGACITLPHKEKALHLVDRPDDVSSAIGAVNAVTVASDGALIGQNTDCFGFAENLNQNAPGWQNIDGPAVVLGAGGAARAVVYALCVENGKDIRLINRTRIKSERLKAQMEPHAKARIDVIDWKHREDALAGAGLLVNTTSLGMRGMPALDLRLDPLPLQALVTDIVYTPLVTPLLAAAAQRGHRTVDGLGMLIHQARPGFQAWFGVDPEVTPELRHFMAAPSRNTQGPAR